MTFKLSSSGILACVVGLFVLLLLGTLVYSIKFTNNKYHEYKLGMIMNSPYESSAKITDKYAMGGGFEIEYQFRGKSYGEVMKVKKEVYNQYKTGESIPITLSRINPSLVSLTSEFNAFKKANP
ncbi:hypothetical protein D0T08_00195 [Emticicia sp. C21]|nr:hypothetical protein D0T08_00195 [Emticicia sp. C21]